MNSPHLQTTAFPNRTRTNSNLSVHSVDNRGAIRRRSGSRSRSVSVSHAERIRELALQSARADYQAAPNTTHGLEWTTPHPSPQPQLLSQSSEPFSQWGVPTPPHSESGLPTLSVDSNQESARSGVSAAQGYSFDHPTTSAEMSSLGFLLPSQYGGSVGLYEQEPSSYTMDQNYIPPMRMSQPGTTAPPPYSQTLSSSPALYQTRTVQQQTPANRRHSERPIVGSTDSGYNQSFRRISSPYESNSEYTVAPSQTIPSISGLTQSPLPSPHMGATSGAGMMPSQYQSSSSRSPNLYDSGMYSQPLTTAPSATQLYAPAQSLSYPPPFVGSSVNDVLSKPSDQSIRVLNQRPKPQCWEHGCNGRQFSTFSNLLRHQREKSGTASKSYCPRCGAEFTRTTARNGHLAHEKCTKQRRHSDEK